MLNVIGYKFEGCFSPSYGAHVIIGLSSTGVTGMTYKGHVRNGSIVLDEPVRLPEGAPVTIELALELPPTDEEVAPSFGEVLSGVIFFVSRSVYGSGFFS
jgi:hypothetical protein